MSSNSLLVIYPWVLSDFIVYIASDIISYLENELRRFEHEQHGSLSGDNIWKTCKTLCKLCIKTRCITVQANLETNLRLVTVQWVLRLSFQLFPPRRRVSGCNLWVILLGTIPFRSSGQCDLFMFPKSSGMHGNERWANDHGLHTHIL